MYNSKMKLFLLYLFFCLGAGPSSYAQQKITGIVSSGFDGSPLPGASVVIKGTEIGTISDSEGRFSIQARNGNDILIASFIGYKAQEIAINSRTVINIELSEDQNMMEEVIVVGYGSVKKKDLTGAVVSVKGEDITKLQSVSFEQGLAARASGVQVVQTEGGPGAGAKIRIRGGTSITANSDPLYVIDGYPIQGSNIGTSTGLGNSSTSPLANIDPSTIESIEILKDASATAIYGSRGANGVVIITTKGGKSGRTNMTYDTYYGVSNIAREVALLSPQEYVDYWNEYFPFSGDLGDRYAIQYRDTLTGNPLSINDPLLKVVDWQDRVLRSAQMNNHNLSINGGNAKTTYAASVGYLNQQGIVSTSNFTRYSFNGRLDQKINSKLSAGVNFSTGYGVRNGIVSASSWGRNAQNGVLTNVSLFTPVQGAIRYPDAQYDEEGILVSIRDNDVVNPDKQVNGTQNVNNDLTGFGSVNVSFKPIDGLSIDSKLGGNIYSRKGKSYYPAEFGWGQATNGRAFTAFGNSVGWLNENTATYTKNFSSHNLNALIGYTKQGSSFESFSIQATGFDAPGVNLDNLGSASVTLPANSDRTAWTLESYLGRINYSFKGKYLLTASGRFDGSSRFAEGGRWGFFPSAALAWRLSEETFIKEISAISNLKLKASYGSTGNNEIGSFRSLASYQIEAAILEGQRKTGLVLDRLANPNLTWETTNQIDLGLELGLLKGKIALEVDFYNKDTRDLLLQVPIPYTSGYTFAFKNIGQVNNRGLEFSLNTVNLEKGKFSWSTSLNLSRNINKVIDLGGADFFTVSSIGENNNDYIVKVGESLGSIFGFEDDGLYQYSDFTEFEGLTDDQILAIMNDFNRNQGTWFTLRDGVVKRAGVTRYRPGMPKLVDQNGDGIVNAEDKTIIGRTQPLFYGGITNNFEYKSFDVSVLFQFSYGNDVYNNNRDRGLATAIPFFNKYQEVRDRWTPTNTDTIVPVIWGRGDAGGGDDAYSYLIEDGSYLRLSNIAFGYRFPKNVVQKLGLNSLRIYGSGDNLALWTKYTGYDPDVSVGFNPLTPGLDWDSYPRQRTYRIGLNIGF